MAFSGAPAEARHDSFRDEASASPVNSRDSAGVAATAGSLSSPLGIVLACGDGQWGALGLGEVLHTGSPVPERLSSLDGMSIKAVSAGARHSCFVTDSGVLLASGAQSGGRLGNGWQPTDRSSTTIEHVFVPMQINSVVLVSKVSCGSTHTLLVTTTGQMFTFGDGRDGKLGHGDTRSVSVPVVVEALLGLTVVSISAGAHSSFAITDTGGLYSFGSGKYGKLGHINDKLLSLPKLVDRLASTGVAAADVSAGLRHTLILSDDGRLFVCGSNASGELGLRDQRQRFVPTQVNLLPPERRVVRVSAGGSADGGHSLVILDDGSLYSFGCGLGGRLGLGDTASRMAPTHVEALAGYTAVAVSAGGRHSLVVTTDLHGDTPSVLWGFGNNSFGQLGVPALARDEDERLLPVRVTAGLKGARLVDCAAGEQHSLVIVDASSALTYLVATLEIVFENRLFDYDPSRVGPRPRPRRVALMCPVDANAEPQPDTPPAAAAAAAAAAASASMAAAAAAAAASTGATSATAASSAETATPTKATSTTTSAAAAATASDDALSEDSDSDDLICTRSRSVDGIAASAGGDGDARRSPSRAERRVSVPATGATSPFRYAVATAASHSPPGSPFRGGAFGVATAMHSGRPYYTHPGMAVFVAGAGAGAGVGPAAVPAALPPSYRKINRSRFFCCLREMSRRVSAGQLTPALLARILPHCTRYPGTQMPTAAEVAEARESLMTPDQNHRKAIQVIVVTVAEALFGNLDAIEKRSARGERVRQCLFQLKIFLEVGERHLPPYVDRAGRGLLTELILARISAVGGWDTFEGPTAIDLIRQTLAVLRARGLCVGEAWLGEQHEGGVHGVDRLFELALASSLARVASGAEAGLPSHVNLLHGAVLAGPVVVQILMTRDIANPPDGQGDTRRCLKLLLTDGRVRCLAFEFEPLAPGANLGVGAKLCLRDVLVLRGHLALAPGGVQFLGGAAPADDAAGAAGAAGDAPMHAAQSQSAVLLDGTDVAGAAAGSGAWKPSAATATAGAAPAAAAIIALRSTPVAVQPATPPRTGLQRVGGASRVTDLVDCEWDIPLTPEAVRAVATVRALDAASSETRLASGSTKRPAAKLPLRVPDDDDDFESNLY